MLDVGCGWGSLLINLAEHTQGAIRGITLSSPDPPLVFKRWMKVVLVRTLPPAGPCCEPIDARAVSELGKPYRGRIDKG